jgi:DNA repair protein SbcD/Mre11
LYETAKKFFDKKISKIPVDSLNCFLNKKMIKVLHTADWHLGKRLEQCERTEEHQYFLDWLVETLIVQKVDVLIVAGDIFDTGNPSNTALKQYYDFLWKASGTCCRNVVIIGGNHDSVAMLDAPKELLRIFNVYVIGGVPDEYEEQIISIKNQEGKTELVVFAVPFLRDKDVRRSIAGETTSQQESRLKQGIADHYHQFIKHIGSYKENKIPVIATGHLYTSGGAASDSESEIHVGTLGRISGDQFPAEFDYIALGHLHRPQVVNKMEHIRYSGSPIPLSFSEAADCKVVVLLEFENEKLLGIQQIMIPPCRKLYRIKGNLDSVKAKLELIQDEKMKLPHWVEIQLETDSLIPDLQEQLDNVVRNKQFIEQLFIRQNTIRKTKNLSEQSEEILNLNDLDARSVFRKKIESVFPDQDMSEMLKTFDEALELYQDEF